MQLGKYLLGPNDTPENGIYTGDARILSAAIPKESVDLIFTDPPYQKEYLGLWPDLGIIAASVLKETGFLLTYCPSAYFEYVFDVLRTHLDFYWPLSIHEPGMNLHYHPKHAICGHKQLLLFRKKNSQALTPRYFPDGLASNFRDKRHHQWGQNLLPPRTWIRYLCPEDDIVVDPFVGGGTFCAAAKQVNRRYLAFEIDPKVAELARERVRNTQPPLPGLITEQLEIPNMGGGIVV